MSVLVRNTISFLGEFSQRIRGVNSLESTDLEMVVEVVFLVVDADIEPFSSRLTVDCVEQRVEFTRGRRAVVQKSSQTHY